MNKSDLINAISGKTGASKADVDKILGQLAETIVSEVKKGNRIAIAKLGIFEKRHRKARSGVNPSSGQTIQISAKDVPAFKPAKHFKDVVAK